MGAGNILERLKKLRYTKCQVYQALLNRATQRRVGTG